MWKRPPPYAQSGLSAHARGCSLPGSACAAVAGPHPDEAVALDDGVGADRREPAHALAGHGDGLAVTSHLEAVIAAHELALDDGAERKRGAAVRAEILQRSRLALGATIQNDRFATDLASEWLVVDFVGHARDVPRVPRKHSSDSLQLMAGMCGRTRRLLACESCGLFC